MKSMNAKSFWSYSASALLVGLVGFAVVRGVVVPRMVLKNPAFAEYQQRIEKQKTEFENADRVIWEKQRDEFNGLKGNYAAWQQAIAKKNRDNNRQITQRKVEEAVAGIKPTSVLRGSDLEGIAYALRAFGKDEVPKARAELLSSLFFNGERRAMITQWLQCSSDGQNCKFGPELSALNDPPRLNRLFAGDKTAVLGEVAYNEPMPEKFKPVADGHNFPAFVAKEFQPTEAAPPEKLPAPRWLGWINWLTLSFFFALGFVLSGYFFWASNGRGADGPWAHPLETVPYFPLGWIIMLVFLPGFVLFRLVHLLTLNAVPTLRRAQAAIVDEQNFERVIAKLERLKQNADRIADRRLTGKIEELLARARAGEQMDGTLIEVVQRLGRIQQFNPRAGLDQTDRNQ